MSDEADRQREQQQIARSSAIRAAVLKFAELAAEHRQADQLESHAKALLEEAKARKKAAYEQYERLAAMGPLFDFDLKEEWSAHQDRQKTLPATDSPSAAATETISEAMAANDKPNMTIKEYALTAAQQAYPNPIRATALRRKLEATGIGVHEKTIGMTLYRLSRDGVLRRNGWDWFFVPEDQRSRAAGRRDEESPGDDPGLPLDAAE
jgi:hypothetical protein